ncbi:hypothetical protein B0H21DRAFT_404024 [Amylocystis lapponica]|nr:hypothetical protein B0H21DRAFT_404024 [Amylocystis lapponica]
MSDSRSAGAGEITLGSAKNSCAQIARVPDDVLHDIFYLAIASSCQIPGSFDEAGSYGGHAYRGSMLSVVLSHVCDYWRNLLLGSPQLWTFIHVVTYTKPIILREFLARSGAALLSVYFEGPDTYLVSTENLHENALLLASHSTRLAEFEGKNLREEDRELILSLFSSPISRLHSLSLHVQNSYAEAWTEVWAYPSGFANPQPRLREVSVVTLSIPWLRYSHLTSLILTYQIAPLLTELVWTLQHCPDLRTLVMTLHGNVSSGVPSLPAPSIINLPRLQELSLKWADDLDALLHIIACLSFPPSTEVELALHGAFETPLDLTHHSPSLRERVAEIRTAWLWIGDETGPITIALCTEDRSFVIEWHWIGEVITGLEHVGLGAIPLPSLEHLVLHDSRSWRSRDTHWALILRQTPLSVEVSVHLRGATDYIAHAFLSALRGTSGVDAPAGNVVCRTLVHFSFIARWDSPTEILKDMLTTFRLRAKRGARLSSLEIQRQAQ